MSTRWYEFAPIILYFCNKKHFLKQRFKSFTKKKHNMKQLLNAVFGFLKSHFLNKLFKSSSSGLCRKRLSLVNQFYFYIYIYIHFYIPKKINFKPYQLKIKKQYIFFMKSMFWCFKNQDFLINYIYLIHIYIFFVVQFFLYLNIGTKDEKLKYCFVNVLN